MLDDLKHRSGAVRGFDRHHRRYALFSRAGFHRFDVDEAVLLVDVNSLVNDRMP